ncbi:MAG: dTDP-4-dehydrorhamnose 3,5-epimerase [Chitinophagaceae bacterium]|nr:dTDP-4-dehydrorhamnose 3,5-epimerase [Chitinophagaceae bacterium]
MNQDIIETNIAAVKLIQQFRAEDHRGVFIKTFHQDSFQQAGINFHMKESFYSISKKNVVRGMHFHHPPYDHDKIVFCTEGKILDIALDLRKNEATYGQWIEQELSADNNQALFIPKGFAHGFLTLSEHATAFYFVSGEYQASADDGIRFDSFGMNWKGVDPIVSARDLSFKSFTEFDSPFN